jgi:hypothetical protein
MRGYVNHAFSSWKNGHADFPHTRAGVTGLSARSVHVLPNRTELFLDIGQNFFFWLSYFSSFQNIDKIGQNHPVIRN